MALPLPSKPSLIALLSSGVVVSKRAYIPGINCSLTVGNIFISSCNLMYAINTYCICWPAIRFALSVAEVRALCWDRVTEETDGLQIRVRRRVKAAAWGLLSCGDVAGNQGGGEKSLELEFEYGKGVKRQRRSDAKHWTTRWKCPSSFSRCDVNIACNKWHRCR